jgi:3-phosphoshikimate 1-carboxyvinyltransferase
LKVTIAPKSDFSGEIMAPPSKAHTHRALVAGLLSEGSNRIQNPLLCDDTEFTLKAISTFGARIEESPEEWIVHGRRSPVSPTRRIYCGESGVTLRFMIPVASLTGSNIIFTVQDRLMRRPLEPLTTAMRQLGVELVAGNGEIHVRGKASGGTVRIAGNVSSQFISGLLLAGPLMERGLIMQLTSPLESRGYVSLTRKIMSEHRIEVQESDDMSLFQISPGQQYVSADYRVPGDYSSAAFILSAAAIARSRMLVRGLPRADSEPDALLLEILSEMGARASFSDDGVLLKGSDLKAVQVNLSDNPDLGPVMAVLGCYATGETRISGAARLRNKESDRLAAITSELSSLGADIKETDDGLIIRGPSSLHAGVVHSHGDHRIAMALCIAALGATGSITLEAAECVSKSYPGFFDDLRSFGVEIVE